MDEINKVLNQIANEDVLAKNEEEYEEMMDALFALYNMQMEAANSYDMDAEYYVYN